MPAPSRYFNRDLSWLEFNDRVLAQAEDDRLPLLERVKFCAIFAGNLDEFFMKRVGLLKRRLDDPDERDMRTRDGLTLPRLAHEIRAKVIAQQARQAAAWTRDLRPALRENGVAILAYNDLGVQRRRRLDRYFDANVFPVLTPLAVDANHRFPFISGLSENFGLLLTPEDDPHAAPSFARVKIPSVVPRYIPLDADDHDEFVPLDELILANLDRLFPGMTVVESAMFRVTRSAAVEEDDDEDGDNELYDAVRQVEAELERRRFAEAVRLETPKDASPRIVDMVAERLALEAEDVYRREGPLEYADLFTLANVPRPDLREKPWRPVVPRALRDLPPIASADAPRRTLASTSLAPNARLSPGGNIFDRIRAGDILVHHPYESFQHSVERFIAEACEDPAVLAIKQTIYRTSPDSPFVRYLVRAAENGKNVACLVELRARFDEQRNVTFARQLEHAGVHVAYGVAGLKTHCKCSLVVRREKAHRPDDDADAPPAPEVIRAYAHLGTGNYHPKTAQLYTDLGLLTCDPKVTGDVVKLFNMLTGHAAEQSYSRLLVAPQHMRRDFEKMVRVETENAREGKPARIIAKMNSLEDKRLADDLYEASDAGVDVTLIVRGFCGVRPQVPGMSDRIRVVSVIGRFLEHSRIYHFANGHADPIEGKFFIGSADWMYRNLNDRVEAVCPVTEPAARRRVWNILDIMQRDRFNAWDLAADGAYARRTPDDASPEGSPERDGTFAALMRDTAP